MRRERLIILWLLVCCSMVSSAGTELAENRELQARIAAGEKELFRRQEENRTLNRQVKNLDRSVVQMETVLAAIKNPAAAPAASPAVEAEKATSETVFDLPFDSIDNLKPFGIKSLDKGWAALVENDGRKVLEISSRKLEKGKKTVLGIWLPKEKIVGRKLCCTVKVEGNDISPAPAHFLGGTFKMMVRADGKTTWPGTRIGAGSFGWKEISFTADIPFSAQSAMLMIGMEGVTGTIRFSALKITAIKE